MNKVLITGTSCGVGRATALKMLSMGLEVFGLDWKKATIHAKNYHHYVCDVGNYDSLPELSDVEYIMNNAGIVTPKADAIRVNQIGYINILKKYADNNKRLKSILMIGSTASIKGYDNRDYCASQGARDALTKWAANNYGNDERHIIVNELRLDGIVAADPEKGIQGTSLEPELYAAEGLMDQIANLSILKRLATVEEIAEWCYFVLVVNTIVTGQIIDVDGELMGAFRFGPYPGWND